MIAYLDTSALVKLVLDEPGSAVADEVWERADFSFCARVAQVELHAAIAGAARFNRIRDQEISAAFGDAEEVLRQCQLIEVDHDLANSAVRIVYEHPLAGYDAVHLAAAESLGSSVLMVTWDGRIAAAAHDRGLEVIGAA